MLDYTTEIPQRNTVPLWNLYASTTVRLYRCGMSKIQQRDTVPLWNIQDSTTVPQYRCGIFMIPQRYYSTVVEFWTFHNGTVTRCWISPRPRLKLAAAKLFHNGTLYRCGKGMKSDISPRRIDSTTGQKPVVEIFYDISPRRRLKLAAAKCRKKF